MTLGREQPAKGRNISERQTPPMTNDTPIEAPLPIELRATVYVAHRYCLPLTLASIIAVSAGIGERAE